MTSSTTPPAMTPPSTPVLPVLVAMAARRSGRAEADISTTATLTDMGIDSLGLAEFMFDIEERYGVIVESDQLGNLHNLEDLSRHIETTLANPAAAAS